MQNYSRKSAHGFVLITSLILLAILSLLATMAVRSSLSSERAGANDRDTSIAREAAELALRDAERDILGVRFDGNFCSLAPATCRNSRPAGTRPTTAADSKNFWIYQNTDAVGLAAEDDGATASAPTNASGYASGNVGMFTNQSAVNCGTAVWSAANWFDGVARTCGVAAAVPTVLYGSFTGAPAIVGSTGATALPNQPRYLVELLAARDLGPTVKTSNKLIFRITSVGFGRIPGPNGVPTSVTLQSTFSPL